MVTKAKELMRQKASTEPIGFNLLPKLFTLSKLQSLYEAIYGETMDKRNFRKRVAGMDYVEKFVQARHPELSLETMRTRSGLRSSAEFLRRSPEIRVLHNADDPILDQEDIRFLNETLKERITWFDCGGHLGNLYLQEYQKELLAAFALPEEAARTTPPNSSEPAERTAPP